ncbi:MAG TPA: zinc ribbon domain-containing protein [Clostridia bacterium]|nr:zinc ribbon domain-containing protein [Clostridia bacterium]
MKKFTTLYQASQYALTLCSAWKFSTSNDFYDTMSLPQIAKTHDEESISDEDSFYVVADSGAIGFVADSEADIDWYFLCRNNPDELLPAVFQEIQQKRFCTNCGKQVKADARFCIYCGSKLS